MRKLTLDDLNQAVRFGGPGALTSVTHLTPAAGEHALIAPARYASKQQGATYVFEDRFLDGELVRTVLVDSRSSAANRLEEAIVNAAQEGHAVLSSMPRIEVTYGVDDDAITFTDAQLPHRAADSHLRAGKVDGSPATSAPAYRAARNATAANAWSLFELSPISLIFGVWDSSRKARQLRLPATVVGEIVGVIGTVDASAAPTRRSGARIDPVGASIVLSPDAAREVAEAQRDDLNADKLDKFRRAKSPVKGSEFVLGAIPPGTEALDGIATRDIVRSHVLSFATIRRLGFGKGVDGDAAIRALLAAVALNALARSDAELYLRANCHLVEKSPTVVTLDRRQGASDELEALTVTEADALLAAAYDQAVALAGVEWSGQVFRVTGNPAIIASASDESDDSHE